MVATTRSRQKSTSRKRAKPAPSRYSDEPRHKVANKALKSLTPPLPQETKDKASDPAIVEALYNLIDRTAQSSTICPSQVPRALHDRDPARYPNWRDMMDEVRDVVWAEVRRGVVNVTQGGVVRTLEERDGLKGPIRVRRGPNWDKR